MGRKPEKKEKKKKKKKKKDDDDPLAAMGNFMAETVGVATEVSNMGGEALDGLTDGLVNMMDSAAPAEEGFHSADEGDEDEGQEELATGGAASSHQTRLAEAKGSKTAGVAKEPET